MGPLGVFLACTAMAAAAPQWAPPPPLATQGHVVTAANVFALRLYQAAAATRDNLVMCPLSAAVLLALTRHGAGGSTAHELTAVMQLDADRRATAAGYRALLESLQQGIGKATLRMANKLYTQRDFRLKLAFRQTAISSFKADTEELDFVGDTENSRLIINQWAEHQTEGKIKDLFEPGSITEDTRVALLNAIYFKAGWFKPFEEGDTSMKPFYVNSVTQVIVPTLHGVFQMYYGEVPELDAIAVKMEYNTEDMAMTLIIPETLDGLERIRAGLQEVDFENLTPSYAEVTLSLPKFKIESDYNLKENLEQLGITEVFTPNADLSNMADPGLYVNDVIQKTFIGVDEKGTEAAVTTGLNFFLRTSFGRRQVKADRPFLFVIHHRNTILFIGQVINPAS